MMKSNKWKNTVFSGMLLVAVGAFQVQAQDGPGGPGGPGGPRPDAMMPGGPMGGRMEILGFGEMHPGAVVSGAPYTAVAVVESKQTLADGNTINRSAQTNISRDSQGRTRRETTFPAVGALAASGQPKMFVMIFDPVAGAAYVLHPDTKIAEKLPTPPGGKKSDTDFQSKFDERMAKEIANGTLKKQDLGVQTVAGISAQGTRYTHTTPAGQMGNEKAIVEVSERWYSPDLQIVVKTTRNDPRSGDTSYTLTSIQRQEPAATLFAVPADYTVQAAKGRPHGKGPHGPGAPSAGPDNAPAPPPGE
jgi:hypothetical protein